MALITLTPAQFAAKRVAGVVKPDATYAGYRQYIAKRRPSAAPAVAAAPVNPMMQLYSTLAGSIPTLGQMGKTSAQTVADTIAQSIAANKAGIAAQDTQLTNQSNRAQGFALALAQATAPNADQVKGYYQEAADRLRGYGTGLTGAVAADQSAAADATKTAVDRVTGGLGVTSGYDPAAIRNAAQMSGVVIPGASLESQAAAAATQAQYGRAASAANIGDIAQQYLAQQNTLRSGVDAQNAALEAQRPTLVRQELASETTQRRQDIATALSALGLINTQKGTQSLIDTRGATTTGKTKTGKPTADHWINPATGNSELIGSGNTIVKVNGVRQKVKTGTTVRTLPNGKQTLVPPKGSAKPPAPAHMQNVTINGHNFLFDPGPPGHYYDPADPTKSVNPNTYKPKAKPLDAGKIQQARAQASNAVTGTVKANPKILPRVLFTNGRAKGIPGWQLLQALKVEAKNHPGDPAWEDVLNNPRWVAGPKKTK